MVTLSDRVIRDEGTPDSVWLPWLARQKIRRASMADLCPDLSRLVMIAPHPDDEVLACGGFLAMRAARYAPSLIVAVTDGEASHGTADAQACARLGARRAEESYAGLRVLGVTPSTVIRLGVPDGQAANYIDSIVKRIAPLVEADDIIVSTWKLDGHPDHEAVSEAARRVAQAKGCCLLQAPVWMWHWAKPDDARIPWSDLVGLHLPTHAIQAKRQALARHRSQLESFGNDMVPVLISSIVERASRADEFFFVS
ncbi:MAG: PIG-L family deacetylase [Pseudomonadota bacterium]